MKENYLEEKKPWSNGWSSAAGMSEVKGEKVTRGKLCEQTTKLKIKRGKKNRKKNPLLFSSHGTESDGLRRLRDLFTAPPPPVYASAQIKRSAASDVHISDNQASSSVIASSPSQNELLEESFTSHRSPWPSYLDLKPERLVVLFLQDHDLSEIKNSFFPH